MKTDFPSALKTPEEVSAALVKRRCDIAADEIRGFADAGYIPCFWWQVNGERRGPYLQSGAVYNWVVLNCLSEQPGMGFPKSISVYAPLQGRSKAAVKVGRLPTALHALAGNIFSVDSFRVVGIYFLVKDNDIVYVGQSIEVPSRVRGHKSTGKKFDSAYFIPVPEAALNEVERAFIAVLKPPLNGTNPKETEDDMAVLETYGFFPVCEASHGPT